MKKPSRRSSGSVTIEVVAREAGVSAMTVSRVINKEKNVRDKTRERVLQIIKKLQYSPNSAARSLAAGDAWHPIRNVFSATSIASASPAKGRNPVSNSMRVIVTADIGGTHARFALAQLGGGKVTNLSEPVTLQTANYATFPNAWREFAKRSGGDIPPGLAIAFAGPVEGEVLKLTNNPWQIRRKQIVEELGLEHLTVINDFAAVAHAVAMNGAADLHHLCGPDVPLPKTGVISLIGPGTGLGVAALVRKGSDPYQVVETEGGHIDFAPLDPLEDRLLLELRGGFRRVSVERIVSGPGLSTIYEILGLIDGHPLTIRDEKALWTAAVEGSDALAAQALERFCLSLGSICGDLALAHGAAAVVIGGGVGFRLKDRLAQSGFRERFVAKGRFERRMSAIPVKVLVNRDAGLLGAAVAFTNEHCREAS